MKTSGPRWRGFEPCLPSPRWCQAEGKISVQMRPPPPPLGARTQALHPAPSPAQFSLRNALAQPTRLLRKGPQCLPGSGCKLRCKLRAGGSGAGKEEKARGEGREGGGRKERSWRSVGWRGRGRGGGDGHGLAAPPHGRSGGGERGQVRGLTWSDWRVLSGLPAIFSPAARGVGAETKPNKPQDTVQTDALRGPPGTSPFLPGSGREPPAAARTLAAACSL